MYFVMDLIYSVVKNFNVKLNFQEAEIVRLEQQHDENLAEISIQLLRLQVIKIRFVITN